MDSIKVGDVLYEVSDLLFRECVVTSIVMGGFIINVMYDDNTLESFTEDDLDNILFSNRENALNMQLFLAF